MKHVCDVNLLVRIQRLPKEPKPPKEPKVRKDRPKPPKEPKVRKDRPVHLAGKQTFIGIDGEGQTDPKTGRHKYVMLCAVSERGETWTVENPKGLSTVECLEFILKLPRTAKIFAYSFHYDLTKILQDVTNWGLYKLFRPEERTKEIQGPKGPFRVNWPVYWIRNPVFEDKMRALEDEYVDPFRGLLGYRLNWLSGRFSVASLVSTEPHPILKDRLRYKWSPSRTINDIWKFYQGKFTTALEAWKVPSDKTPEERDAIHEHMREMKDKRANFDKMPRNEVHAYCLDECRYMAELARKLKESHEKAGIPLRSYFGAGSSASAMLDKLGVKQHITQARKDNPIPRDVEHAIKCAFFGGRFENSRVGAVPGPVYSYDISSAYPYQLCFLPCLVHGQWEKTRKRADIYRPRTAIVRYRLFAGPKKETWAPLPFRMKDGSIVFPKSSGGGWVWREEYLAAERHWEGVHFRSAWLYHTECDCVPFKGIPDFYRERLRLGKEGPGIVLKLGTNSCYGKTAQSVGGQEGQYTSWMWAGLITSGTRAQILEAIGLHKDRRNLLMVATDGIATLEELTLPAPIHTGTNDCVDDKGKIVGKPLGGWEAVPIPKGLFLARPGIYFPLQPTKKELAKVRGRGVGRAIVYEQWETIVEAWKKAKSEKKLETTVVALRDLSRFLGAKTSVLQSGKAPDTKYKRKFEYGQWIVRPVEMSFDPLPKRASITKDGTLRLRRVQGESAPYDKKVMSPDAIILKSEMEIIEEQPDGGDYAEGDYGE